MRIGVTALGCALLASGAQLAAGPSEEVNAEQFYTTARQVEKKGALALFDKRAKVMQAQIKDAALSARAANAAATDRGSPLFCVPEAARKKGLNVQQVLDMLGGLGQPLRQSSTLQAAWLEALKKSYPCR